MHVPMQVKNITFVSILFIYSHYETDKPFLTGATFFCPPPVIVWLTSERLLNIIFLFAAVVVLRVENRRFRPAIYRFVFLHLLLKFNEKGEYYLNDNRLFRL